MRFGFILTNLAGGGAEKAVLNIAAGLAERGHRAELIVLEQVVVHALPAAIGFHPLAREGRKISKGWLGKRLAARRLAGLLRELAREAPFDLLVSTLPFADEVAIAAGAPALRCRIANTLSAEVARLAASDAAKAARRLARYRRLYDGRALIAVSAGVADDLRTGIGLGRADIEVIANPFDLAAMKTLAAAPAGLPRAPYVIHVGRFSAQKRHDLLLDAFARLDSGLRLVLLADEEAGLRAMIAARGLAGRVEVAGFQQNPFPWIAAANLLVLCSDHEGLPNVIIEALALGVPVVSTDCPSGPREILGQALPDCLVPTGDAAALAAAMARTLAKRPEVARVDLSRYAKERVLAAYEQVAQAAPRRA
jgi:glycosyltransferase involved in cell wall biosynthesis